MNMIAIESGMATVVKGLGSTAVEIEGPDIENKDKRFKHNFVFKPYEESELNEESKGDITTHCNDDFLYEEKDHSFLEFKILLFKHVNQLNDMHDNKYFYIQLDNGVYIDVNEENCYKKYLESVKENV